MTATVPADGAVVMDAVVKNYGAVQAVRGVSFKVSAGECLALVGHNGAGKTTLIKLMLGLVRLTEGKLSVLGDNPISGSSDLRGQIGFLPENVAFNSSLTGRELLTFYARLKDAREEVDRLLDLVGLTEAASRRLGTYSKGMRQRLGLAQALLGGPRLLLLDEPTTGLDPALRRHFYQVVGDLAHAGTAVIISSHALAELEEFADRVVILDRGRLLAGGSLDELRNLARLPVRFRIRLDAGRTPDWLRLEARKIDNGWFELACDPADKMTLIRRLAALEDIVTDLDIDVPTLDQLYASFLGHRTDA